MASDLVARLRQSARSLRVSPAAVFHAAWGLVVARAGRARRHGFGGVLSGRRSRACAASIGRRACSSIPAAVAHLLPALRGAAELVRHEAQDADLSLINEIELLVHRRIDRDGRGRHQHGVTVRLPCSERPARRGVARLTATAVLDHHRLAPLLVRASGRQSAPACPAKPPAAKATMKSIFSRRVFRVLRLAPCRRRADQKEWRRNGQRRAGANKSSASVVPSQIPATSGPRCAILSRRRRINGNLLGPSINLAALHDKIGNHDLHRPSCWLSVVVRTRAMPCSGRDFEGRTSSTSLSTRAGRPAAPGAASAPRRRSRR